MDPILPSMAAIIILRSGKGKRRHAAQSQRSRGSCGARDDCNEYWRDVVIRCCLLLFVTTSLIPCSQERRECLKKMGLLLQTYDNDRSGDLDTREITNLITDREIRNGRDIPTVPNEAEISWILQSAGKHRENAIDVTELDFALKLWDEYVRNRAKFEKMFSIKIESSHSQRLEFDQLKLFLTKLTGYPLKVRMTPY